VHYFAFTDLVLREKQKSVLFVTLLFNVFKYYIVVCDYVGTYLFSFLNDFFCMYL